MNCNIFRVQFANYFHIFLHIGHGLAGKSGNEIHVDDGKSRLAAGLIHGINIFDAVAPSQGVEQVLLHGLGIDADAVDAAAFKHGKDAFFSRIGTARFDGPFAGVGKILGQALHEGLQHRLRQTGRRPAADVETGHVEIVVPAKSRQIVEVSQHGIAKGRELVLPFPADEA